MVHALLIVVILLLIIAIVAGIIVYFLYFKKPSPEMPASTRKTETNNDDFDNIMDLKSSIPKKKPYTEVRKSEGEGTGTTPVRPDYVENEEDIKVDVYGSDGPLGG